MSEDIERDTIPKEDVKAALKEIEEAFVKDSDRVSNAAFHRIIKVIAAQRRELGIEKVN